MSKRTKYTAEEKLKIILEYKDSSKTILDICSFYEISKSTFRVWRYNYERYGIKGLKESMTCKHYSKVLKEQAILDYLSGLYSQNEIIKKYEISSRSVLKEWIKRYNSHRELKDTVKGLSCSMTKGRSTTLKERIEIVLYCIDNNHNYQRAAKTFKVSYQQVYNWVKKYESGGKDALIDKRGRKKEEKELTEEEKTKLVIKKLESDNERLRAENAFLKKLQEVGRRRY